MLVGGRVRCEGRWLRKWMKVIDPASFVEWIGGGRLCLGW